MKTVFIKGLGLIGSSLARAIRKEHPNYQIIASDIDQEALQYAVDHQIIDVAVHDFGRINTADFIILASPVSQIISDIKVLAQQQLKPGVIVTDVGSTKQTVMQTAEVLRDKGISFVGGHPMAGSHLSGVRAGDADLVKDHYYFLMTEARVGDLQRVKNLLNGTHAKWLELAPAKHDQLVAQISHLPHIIAAELVNQAHQTCGSQLNVAAGGFKSVTRIAASDPTMWSAILLNNKQPILHQLDDYILRLTRVKDLIEKEDKQKLFDLFAHARQTRRKLDEE